MSLILFHPETKHSSTRGTSLLFHSWLSRKKAINCAEEDGDTDTDCECSSIAVPVAVAVLFRIGGFKFQGLYTSEQANLQAQIQ